MSIRKILPDILAAQGEMLPKWYGVAFYDYMQRTAICYPIPLNLIVRFIDNIWWRIKQPHISDREADLMAAYSKGRMDGRNETLKDFNEMLDRKLAKILKASNET